MLVRLSLDATDFRCIIGGMKRTTVALHKAADKMYTVTYTVLLSILVSPVRSNRSENAPVGVGL